MIVYDAEKMIVFDIAIVFWYLQNERKNFEKNIFHMRPKFAKFVSSERNFYTTFSNAFSPAEWRLSLSSKLPLEKTWQVMLHYHAESGDVKSILISFMKSWNYEINFD